MTQDSNFSEWPRLVWIVPAMIAALGALPLPYGYYMIVRVTVFATSGLLCWATFNEGPPARAWALAFGVLALLFNPIVPVHLTKMIWAGADLGTAALLIGHMLYVRRL